MDAKVKQRPRHRTSREPLVAPDGHIIEHEFRPASDVPILMLMARHRYLRAVDIATWLGRSEKATSYRLRALKTKDMGYVKIADAQRDDKGLTRAGYLYFDLDQAGIDYLKDHEGIVLPKRATPKTFVHAVMAEQIVFSIALALKDRTDYRLRFFEDLLPEMPEATRAMRSNQRFAVGNGEWVRGDYPAFKVERTSDGKGRYIGKLEGDTGSMNIETSDPERSAIANKFIQDMELLKRNVVADQFGWPHAYFAYVTSTRSRMERMVSLLEKMTESTKDLRKWFIFNVQPTIKTPGTYLPTGHIFDDQWMRAGLDPIQL